MKAELLSLGLPTSGLKAELAARLTEAIAANPALETELDAAAPEDEQALQRVHVHWGGTSWSDKTEQATREPNLEDAISALGNLDGVNQARAKALSKVEPWREATLSYVLWKIYKFDPIRDCIPDLMHQLLVLIKQQTHATVDLFEAHNQHVWLNRVLKNFRADLPSWVSRGRRIPWHMTHKVLKAWTAEECLVWVRIVWQHVFLELKLSRAEDVDEATLKEINAFQQMWELIGDLYSALNHTNGMQGEPERVVEIAVSLVHFIDAGSIGGVDIFNNAFMTYTVHQLLHLVQYTLWWGNLWEHWCFVYERTAGLYTRLLRGWNHRNEAGACAWLQDRVHLKSVTEFHLQTNPVLHRELAGAYGLH